MVMSPENSEPQPTRQRHHYTTYVFTGKTKEERQKRLAATPDSMRDYVKTRVEALFGFKRRG